jgi:flagellar motor switch protein FliG
MIARTVLIAGICLYVKLSDVEGAQKEILQIVRTLFEEGQIMLSNKGDESYV